MGTALNALAPPPPFLVAVSPVLQPFTVKYTEAKTPSENGCVECLMILCPVSQ